MSDVDDICVVTHPIGSATESHASTLLNILSSITTVSLVAVSVAEDSPLRDQYDVEAISESTSSNSVLLAALRFVYHQVQIARVLRRRPEPTVLFFGVTSYLLPILAAKASGKRVILEPRGDVPLTLRLQWEQRMPSPIARLLAGSVALLEMIGYRTADVIITYTPSMAEELGLDKYEHKLYPQGARYVDLDQFYPRVSFEERERVVGFLGRLDEEKGIRTLAAVATELPDDITFRFIGDGDLREWLEDELADEIAAGHVEITGWVDHEQVPEELSRLQLLVMPSAPTEGLPTTILEAMACGTPVYATPVSGVPDVVIENKTGLLISNTQPQKISCQIESLYEQKKLSAMSDNARDLISEEHNYDAAVSRYRHILTNFCS